MESVLYITSNAIRVYAISIFITSFLGKSRLSPGMNRLIYLLYFLISTVGWLYWKSPTLNLFLNTLPLLGITLQYDSGWSKKIFSVIISCAVGMFVDWIAIAAFGDVQVIKSGFVQCNVILICAVLFRRYYKRKETCLFRSKYVWLLIFTSIGTGAIGEVLSTPLIGEPLIGEPLIGVTQSFISFGAFDKKSEAVAAYKYICSKFARVMLGILKVTQDNSKETWKFVPMQDFTDNSDIDWSKSIEEIDRQLYRKYELDQPEIDFIEKMIKPME